jgi:hypothetical protein
MRFRHELEGFGGPWRPPPACGNLAAQSQSGTLGLRSRPRSSKFDLKLARDTECLRWADSWRKVMAVGAMLLSAAARLILARRMWFSSSKFRQSRIEDSY